MIDTESLTIPSPKITLNNLGYLSDLIIAKAATLSVAQMVAENKRISLFESGTESSKLLYLRIKSMIFKK